jgi:hypothetical protein
MGMDRLQSMNLGVYLFGLLVVGTLCAFPFTLPLYSDHPIAEALLYSSGEALGFALPVWAFAAGTVWMKPNWRVGAAFGMIAVIVLVGSVTP